MERGGETGVYTFARDREKQRERMLCTGRQETRASDEDEDAAQRRQEEAEGRDAGEAGVRAGVSWIIEKTTLTSGISSNFTEKGVPSLPPNVN